MNTKKRTHSRRRGGTRAAEKAVALTPGELRTILEFVGLRDHRADSAVRLLEYLGRFPGASEVGACPHPACMGTTRFDICTRCGIRIDRGGPPATHLPSPPTHEGPRP